MQKERLFLDIRFYESNKEGVMWPQNVGSIFLFPTSIHSMGARIARKLREYGFTAGVFDHLYINLTSCIEDGKIQYSKHNVDPRIQYVQFGLQPKFINALSVNQKEEKVCEATFKVLKFITKDKQYESLIDRVASEYKEKGTELEILHKMKETSTCSVVISYTVAPFGKESSAFIQLTDKRTGNKTKKEFLKLKQYEDIYSLVGTISIDRDSILLKPRTSYKASLNTSRYNVPFEIKIEELKDQYQ
jgi:hypothetical protein